MSPDQCRIQTTELVPCIVKGNVTFTPAGWFDLNPPWLCNAKNNVVYPSRSTKWEGSINFRPAFNPCAHYIVGTVRNLICKMRSYYRQAFRNSDRQRNRFVINVLDNSPLVTLLQIQQTSNADLRSFHLPHNYLNISLLHHQTLRKLCEHRRGNRE